MSESSALPHDALSPGAFSDDPAEAMASLGVALDDSAAPDMAGLAALRAQLSADLEQKQGPFRRQGPVGRYWPFALALALGALSVVLLKPIDGAEASRLLASGLAALSGVVCLFAAAWAPTRPSLGERLALLGIVVGGAALLTEGAVASSMPHEAFDMGAKCSAVLVAVALLPMAALFFGLKRAGLPVRRMHAAGLAVSAMAMAGATIWLHCPADNAMHLFAGHMAVPLLIVVALSAALFRLFAPKPSV